MQRRRQRWILRRRGLTAPLPPQIRTPDLPVWWRWAANICFMRYGFGVVVKNQFSGDNDIPYLIDETTGTMLTVQQYYAVDGISLWGWVGIAACFFFVFFGFTFLALRFINHVKR